MGYVITAPQWLQLLFKVFLKEIAPEVQAEVGKLWDEVTNDNIPELTDFAGYKSEFMRLFGFGLNGVDYAADTNPDVKIKHLIQM